MRESRERGQNVGLEQKAGGGTVNTALGVVRLLIPVHLLVAGVAEAAAHPAV